MSGSSDTCVILVCYVILIHTYYINLRDFLDERLKLLVMKETCHWSYSWNIGIHIFWIQIQYSFCYTSLEVPVNSGNS